MPGTRPTRQGGLSDAAGIRAMAGAVEWRRGWPLLRSPAGSLISVGLRDQSGKFLPGLSIGDRWFVAGGVW